ncbi:DUF4394 domain-containing protein [Aminobacter anthyllidis]|nr:DUF4394 domain-containing protein [Aminobacter anthyllidis]MDH4988429.1 DUF4394 domain-containing protein [Aminobacter anthyllidis]
MNRIALHIALAGTMLAGFSAAAVAAPALGLSGDKTLIWFDTDKPGEARKIEVTGVDKLHGIDLRSSDNMVYGLAGDGSLVTINLDTGAATAVSKLSKLPPEGAKVSVDFNPAADKLRVIASDGTNLRADPATGAVTEDGKLAFEAGDASAEMPTEIIATAYTNSFGKPEKTAMYDIHAGGLFLQQTKPNDGTLKTIGKLGIEPGDAVGFDIQTSEDGANTAWLATGGMLYKVSMESGAAEKAAEGLDAGLRDLAILR